MDREKLENELLGLVETIKEVANNSIANLPTFQSERKLHIHAFANGGNDTLLNLTVCDCSLFNLQELLHAEVGKLASGEYIDIRIIRE